MYECANGILKRDLMQVSQFQTGSSLSLSLSFLSLSLSLLPFSHLSSLLPFSPLSFLPLHLSAESIDFCRFPDLVGTNSVCHSGLVEN